VVDTGVTITFEPVIAPGFHVYEEAPVAVNVEDPTTQIAVGDAVALTVGFAFTTSDTVFEFEQPEALSPVTV
jgi:hypothetical protein